MADPFPRRFHMKLWPWLAVQFVLLQLGMLSLPLLIVAIETMAGREVVWRTLLSTYAGASTAAVLACLAITIPLLRACAVWVGPGGVWTYTYWWLPMVVPLDCPATVERRSMVGVPYLKVTAEGLPQVAWVPIHLVDAAGFADAVAAEGGDDHPLAVAVRERLADD